MSIVSGDGSEVMTQTPSRPEARSRGGWQTANELGAPLLSFDRLIGTGK
jgi:hypothetical protein